MDFLYLSEPDMIKAGVEDMKECVDVMEDLLITLYKGDYVMGGENHNSHGCMITFPDDPKFPGMPKNADDRRFMAMPAYLGGRYQMAGMKWYGSNVENKKKGLPRSILMMMLNDKDTGAPLALMSANLLSAYRTGGIPGVGAKYLARKDSKVAAIIGPGVMGKTSLEAFVSVCPNLDTVKIKGRGKKSMDSFTAFVREKLPQIKNIEICDTVESAVRDSDRKQKKPDQRYAFQTGRVYEKEDLCDQRQHYHPDAQPGDRIFRVLHPKSFPADPWDLAERIRALHPVSGTSEQDRRKCRKRRKPGSCPELRIL